MLPSRVDPRIVCRERELKGGIYHINRAKEILMWIEKTKKAMALMGETQ